MYLPPAFALSDLGRLHDFIEQNSFGLLVSQIEGEPFATHLPFLLDRAVGDQGTLVGHVARANPHWRHLDAGAALAVFHGPHAYISPSWYEAEDVVPTWNYLAVHVVGHVTIVDDEPSLLKIVQDLVAVYERTMPRPWSFDPSTTFCKRMLSQIVGFRIAISKIEGKFKLSQNHPIDRRKNVVAALRQRSGEDDRAIAAAMQATYQKASDLA